MSSESPDWAKLHAVLKPPLDARADKNFRALKIYLPRLMADRGYTDSDGVLDQDLREVARETARDIQRLLIYQSGDLDRLKYAAYLGFWFRKLQPIPRAFQVGASPTGSRSTVHDINERVALFLMAEVYLAICTVDNVEGIDKQRAAFERFFKSETYDYVVQSMRHRTFGPHHFVMLGMMIRDGA